MSGSITNADPYLRNKSLKWLATLRALLEYSLFVYNRSEGFALTGYDIPGCVEDGAWMPWENSSAAVAAAAAVAHPDLENRQFSSFVTESELPECADRSVSSKRVPPAQFLRKVVAT